MYEVFNIKYCYSSKYFYFSMESGNVSMGMAIITAMAVKWQG